MLKSTYLTKENYKKVEEVREIESQVLSLEEFASNYNQEQVNYSDLTHEDVSLNKVYGPCDWSNPRCSCQYGERWTYLTIPCPVSGCGNRNIVNQIHACGGQVEISNKARVQCRGCGDVSHVRDWRFSCSNHYSSQADATYFLRALMIANKARRIEADFVDELFDYLEGNFW